MLCRIQNLAQGTCGFSVFTPLYCITVEHKKDLIASIFPIATAYKNSALPSIFCFTSPLKHGVYSDIYVRLQSSIPTASQRKLCFLVQPLRAEGQESSLCLSGS
ncbi:hypothetical protein KIL84_013580 [Mauremys mutica]|uniref:Uncharacterized protein n=1 Tax=Mauremys mutica TaxID=74926 RepID=A0A9D4AUH0_9SAUR|nr:hypothetical protein KIL84_013580 [Mauremys mutica]